MKSLLIFPPGWNPNGPYLALPVLKSFLKNNNGISADILDLNIEYFNHILTRDYIEFCYQKIESENRMNNTLLLIQESTLLFETAKDIFQTYKLY